LQCGIGLITRLTTRVLPLCAEIQIVLICQDITRGGQSPCSAVFPRGTPTVSVLLALLGEACTGGGLPSVRLVLYSRKEGGAERVEGGMREGSGWARYCCWLLRRISLQGNVLQNFSRPSIHRGLDILPDILHHGGGRVVSLKYLQ
jgi:hypothetical protein